MQALDAGRGPGALASCPHCGNDHPEDKLKCPETDMVMPLAGRLLQGKFRFLEPIGRGGMAEVWLARNELVDREVALKLIRPEVLKQEENVARFRSEARAAGRIGSPHICDILDFGLGPLGPFIVMERLRGVSLGEILRARKQLPPAQAVMIMREALVGLGAAHRSGIIHRDLKPENVFLHRPEGGEPVVKLMDFGVSKFTDGSAELETQHGVLLGTPEYMAPEQCRGARNADARTDIWAVGAILYRALAGVDAFHGESLAATLMIVATEAPVALGTRVPGLDPGLVAVVEKCLAKSPDDRYQDVAELAHALDAFQVADGLEVWRELGGISDNLTGLASAPTKVRVPAPSEVATAPREVVGPPPAASARASTNRWAAILGLLVLVGGLAFALGRPWGRENAPSEVVDPPAPEAAPEASPPAPTKATALAVEPTGIVEAGTSTGGLEDEPRGESAGLVARAPTLAPELAEPDDGDDDGGENSGPYVPPPDHVDPEGVLRVEKWVTVLAVEKAGDQRSARKHCEKLAADGHLGIRGWKLANPTVAAKFTGARKLKSARYWTSAAHKGRARAITLPSGKVTSIDVSKRSARPLCVAKWP